MKEEREKLKKLWFTLKMFVCVHLFMNTRMNKLVCTTLVKKLQNFILKMNYDKIQYPTIKANLDGFSMFRDRE